MKEPPEELLIEWPEGDKKPWKYWLSSLPPDRTSFRGLLRKAKGPFRVEQDYEEMKGEVGLDHFEGRSWEEWHHHVTLVTLAYAFLTLERMGAIKKTSGLTLPAVRRLIQKCLILYRGICPICNTVIFDDS
jgi:SRSO17 transposase